jgi:hypothetical protein
MPVPAQAGYVYCCWGCGGSSEETEIETEIEIEKEVEVEIHPSTTRDICRLL